MRLPVGVTTAADGRPDDRIAATAKEFEATFLSLLLKEMRQTLDQENGGLFAGDTADVHGGLFDLFLGKHLAEAGGIGVASALERQLRYTKNASPLPPSAGPGPARPPQS